MKGDLTILMTILQTTNSFCRRQRDVKLLKILTLSIDRWINGCMLWHIPRWCQIEIRNMLIGL